MHAPIRAFGPYTILGIQQDMVHPEARYLIIKELGLKDHDSYGFGGLSP